jgi:hypothetical protein
VQALADGTPALGIVAAVLGVIKTMGSIAEPPEVLGHMIGGALVGTFLGVFVAYGFFGPMAQSLRNSYRGGVEVLPVDEGRAACPYFRLGACYRRRVRPQGADVRSASDLSPRSTKPPANLPST